MILFNKKLYNVRNIRKATARLWCLTYRQVIISKNVVVTQPVITKCITTSTSKFYSSLWLN